MNSRKLSFKRLCPVIVLLSIALHGCGKDSQKDGHGESGGTASVSSSQNSQFSYEFSESVNGVYCTTGRHEFTNQTDLCLGLIDDVANQGCARRERIAMAQSRCSMTEVADHGPAGHGESQPAGSHSMAVRQGASENLLRFYDDRLILTSFAPESTVPASNSQDATFDLVRGRARLLAQEIQDCGITIWGTGCLDRVFRSDQALQSSYRISGASIFLVQFNDSANAESQASGRLVMAAAYLARPGSTPLVQQVELFSAQAGRTSQSQIRDDYFSRSLIKLGSFSAMPTESEQLIGNILAALRRAESGRPLYHLAGLLAQVVNNTGRFSEGAGIYQILETPTLQQRRNSILSNLAQIFSEKKALFNSSASETYQIEYLRFIEQTFGRDHRPAAVELGTSLLQSQSSSLKVKISAALMLASLNAVTPEIRRLVIRALDNSEENFRIRAIVALSRVRTGIEDDRLIIAMLGDANYYVRRQASVVLQNLAITSDHLAKVLEISRHAESSVRQSAAALLGRIAGDAATNALIGLLADSDYYVRRQANELLVNRPLGAPQLQAVSSIASQSGTDPRSLAVTLLARINSAESTQALLSLATDSDYYIRRHANEILEARGLGSAHLATIQGWTSNNSTEIRARAVTYLGRIDTAESTMSLISTLADSDYYIRRQARDVLLSQSGALRRSLNDSHIRQLGQILDSNQTESRMAAIQILKKTSSRTALSLLVARNRVEVEYYTKQALAEAIAEIATRIGA